MQYTGMCVGSGEDHHYRGKNNYFDIVYVCLVITFSRLGINRVWLPILVVVS